MSLPVGVETRTIRLTVPLDTLGRPPKVFAGTVQPDRTLIWGTTGDRLWPAGAKLPDPVGGFIEFDVPIVDQDGWIEKTGAPAASWAYRLVVTGTWEAKKRTVVKDFQVFEASPDVIDLELTPDGPLIPPVDPGNPYVVSVLGHTGGITGEQLRAGLESYFERRGSWSPASFVGLSDGDAVRAAYDAAAGPLGPGGVTIDRAYYCSGEVVQPGGVIVRGTSANLVLKSGEDDERPGLYAADETFRYRYGSWADLDGGTGPDWNSEDDNPGGLYDLVIDGRDVGGVDEGLFVHQGVDGFVLNCRIVRSAGDGFIVDGAQNFNVEGGYIGLHAGRSIDFRTLAAGQQGSGNAKFRGVYVGTSGTLMRSTSDPAAIWPHDVMFTECLFENYTPGNDLVHIQAGGINFTRCVFTNSNAGVVDGVETLPPNDCLVLIDQTVWPVIPTMVTFDSCYFISSKVHKVRHMVRVVTPSDGSAVGNHVHFLGRTYAQGADYLVGVDGGGAFSSTVTMHGPLFTDGVGVDGELFEALNGAWLHRVQNVSPVPHRIEVGEGDGLTFPLAFGIKRAEDLSDSWRISRDGFMYWQDGAEPPVVNASLGWDAVNTLHVAGGPWRFANGFGLRTGATPISAAGQAVDLVAAGTAFPAMSLYFQFNNASANVTLSGGFAGQHFEILLDAKTYGTTGNSVTWPANISFRGTAPQPVAGQVVTVTIAKYGAIWTEVSRSGMPTTGEVGAQPLDSDLTAIAALSTTSYGRSFLTLADAAAARTLTGAAAASDLASLQPLDSDLTAIAALATTSYGRALLTLSGQGALVALLPSYQPLDSDLTSIAALVTAIYGRSLLTLTSSTALTNEILAATEALAGRAEIATQTETNTGTDDVRFVTPLKLATRLAAYAQPLDSDLTAIAALATTTFGRSLLTLADSAALVTQVSSTLGHIERSADGSQSYGNGAAGQTAVLWQTSEVAARGGITYSAGVFTIGVAGTYQVDGFAGFAASSVGRRQLITQHTPIATGVARSKGAAVTPATSAGQWLAPIGGTFDCAAGDTIQVLGFQDSGGALALSQGYLTIHRVP